MLKRLHTGLGGMKVNTVVRMRLRTFVTSHLKLDNIDRNMSLVGMGAAPVYVMCTRKDKMKDYTRAEYIKETLLITCTMTIAGAVIGSAVGCMIYLCPTVPTTMAIVAGTFIAYDRVTNSDRRKAEE